MTESPAKSVKCWGVIPAAGSGSRMAADVPKQYLQVAGATVLEHSLNALLRCDFIERVLVAISPGDKRAGELPALAGPRVLLVEGGEQRSDSVLAALVALHRLASPQDWVLVHDAARPCVAPGDISELARQVIDSGIGGILATPIVDTVKRSGDDKRVVETLARERLWCAQTPQMFRLGVLRAALEDANSKGLAVTDEASAMELYGEAVQLVQGSPDNLKVTLPQDLHLAEYYLSGQRSSSQ
ncbi:MAG: 2-C-methyl-D-erythritol 4-phosphate cytidylyltransferase [Proteobacteria bacterium]|nr:2-C-methyl-D-erythritol 4-phosphate cytidylyltransferase [Pseudomonadota bacterium]